MVTAMLAASAGTLGAQASGSAPAEALSVTIQPPGALRAGTTAELMVTVSRPPDQDHPLLLTPSAEGAAIEVVRGRLLRADARSRERGQLRFAVPLRMRERGPAIVRVEVQSYRCASRCEAVSARAAAELVVE